MKKQLIIVFTSIVGRSINTLTRRSVIILIQSAQFKFIQLFSNVLLNIIVCKFYSTSQFYVEDKITLVDKF